MPIKVVNLLEMAAGPDAKRTNLINGPRFNAWFHIYKRPGQHDEMHCHNADQTFYCIEGECTMHFPDGGKEVLSERRRQLTDRRQQARSFIGEFVDEVRFEADGRLATLVDDVQRQMRARFADRILELHRTYTDSAEALESAAAQAGEGRRRRRDELLGALVELDAVAARIAALGPVVVASGS